MRLALISDVHGNLEALTAALEIINKRSVDEIVCLGDTIGYGADPGECLKLVRESCALILLGNHDAAAVNLSVADNFTVNARLSAIWTHHTLTDEDKQFLSTLPLSKERDTIFFVHASPQNPGEWNYIINDYDAQGAFESFTHRICFVGHSHVPAIFSEGGTAATVTNRDRFIVNVGSVGQPRDGNAKLSFGIFDTDSWAYENIRADYDKTRAAEKIRKAGLPISLADRLMVGL